ncbi:hypothetical protein C7N43_24420 [Sphingobacteriales bacterium UPWRP_1]|nr:hypothetical protein BVG80_16760 [Sphingobacteriales bacterium TSM_CSM]PSJ74352.1 hypothetical protein C7N43_24420 [Sphingobacteriales bacterium UPWRP_1]
MEQINIVWFTNDLRLDDHAPLYYAAQTGLPVLLLYCFDPQLLQHPTFGSRHGWFALHALQEMQLQLHPFKHIIYTPHIEIRTALELLADHYQIINVFLHKPQAAMQHVRQQHYAAQQFCRQKNIQWQAFNHAGLFDEVSGTPDWEAKWKTDMLQMPYSIHLPDITTLKLPTAISAALYARAIPKEFKKGEKPFLPDTTLQTPGPANAARLLDSFVQNRASGYRSLRKQAFAAQTASGRLSAHLAFGNISVRQVYRRIRQARATSAFPSELTAFADMLKLRSFCLQQFNLHPNLEYENLNYVVNGIRIKWNETQFEKFTEAKTGFPLTDAAVLCLKQTGYLNHRLRALLASFVTLHLWLDWRKAAPWFARHMTDFEPGIFYWYMQIISGCTGVFPAWVANPAREARKIDPNGLFIKQWLPQFMQVPGALCGNPQAMSALEQKMYHCEPGKNYPFMMISPETTGEFAATELQRIYSKHIAVKETARLQKLLLPLPARFAGKYTQ